MLELSIKWAILNIILLIFFLYFVTQGYILLSVEEETLEQDTTVYDGIAYIGIYEILLIFLLFAKIVYLIFLKIDRIDYDSVKTRIETLEYFCFIPQIIEMFLLIAQISYYNGYRFTKKEEFLQISAFKTYCQIKIIFGIVYCIWLLGCFLLLGCGMLCYTTNFCQCCLQECECDCLIDEKKRRDILKKRNKKMRQNKIYAV